MKKKILFIGESWFTYSVHQKGFDTFYTSEYIEGADKFLNDMRALEMEIDYVPAHLIEKNVPNTVEELKAYDVIIISDVGANSFLLGRETFTKSKRVPNKLEAISDYVEHGGGLLMIGGYMTFTGIDAKARFGQSPLKSCLPVNLLPYDDRVEIPEGVVPIITESHEILNDLPSQWPHLLGYNQFYAKSGSKTLVSVGEDPLLVVGTYGAGRTGAFASDLAPHWAPTEFVEWEFYQKFWGQLITWIANK